MSLPTDARTVALEFCALVYDSFTKSQIQRAVIQAKQILNEGYTVDDVLLVINYILSEKKVNMYSLGYVKATIAEILPLAIAHRDKKQAKLEQEKLIQEMRSKEVENESERNREKAKRYGVQSRFGEKHSFDLLTE